MRAVLEDGLARRVRIGEHRRVDMHHHLIALSRGAGIDPVMKRRLGEQGQRISLEKRAIVWRNYEASLDTASLEPRTRGMSTYLLQEYFIPVAKFLPFARDMAGILRAHKTWAPTEVFSFVLYYKQRNSERASAVVAAWTRELIDAALGHGGRYYLPYRLDATRAQFSRAYPKARAFAALKARVDPGNRFRNLLWDKYLRP